MDNKTRDLAVAFFDANPSAQFAYVFWDGRVIEDKAYASRMTSRAAGLVAIASDGFPMLVSRRTAKGEGA